MRALLLQLGLAGLAMNSGMAHGADERPGALVAAAEGRQRGEDLASGEAGASSRRLEELLQGDGFFPNDWFAEGRSRCLTGKSREKDTVARKGRVRVKDCTTTETTKNKARWKVEGSLIKSVLLDKDGDELCLVPNKVKEHAKIKTIKCTKVTDDQLWDNIPNEGGGNEALMQIIGTDNKGVEVKYCVNLRAKLKVCEDQEGVTQVTLISRFGQPALSVTSTGDV